MWKHYLYQPKSVLELLKDSIIVIDTNVLLAAYQWREVTVNEVLKTLQQIKDEDRLRIPLQVIKEFSKNRTKEIKQRMNDIDQVISRLQKDNKPVKERVPMLEGKDILQNIEVLQEGYHKALKEYKDGLVKLRDHLRKLFYEDQFLNKIMEIAEGAILFPEEGKTFEDLKKEAEERFKNKVPPGFKDSPKEENSSGDYIVWSSILQLDSDVVFVSGDKKDDWVYRDNNDNPIIARRELIEEYFLKTGKDFAHITPKEFITNLNPSISEYVKEDLSNYNKINIEETLWQENVEIASREVSESAIVELTRIIERLHLLIDNICLKNNIEVGSNIHMNLDSLIANNIIDPQTDDKIRYVIKVRRDLVMGLQNTNDFVVYFAIKTGKQCLQLLSE